MYLSGSKWHMTKKRRKRSRPFRVIALLALIGAAVYLQQVIVPRIPPPFVPTPTPTRNPASFALEAETHFAAGQLDQAIQSYQQAIAADPEQSAFYVAMARVQVFAGRPEDAQVSARDALLIDPGSSLAHAVLGWSLDFLSQLTDAQVEVERALEIDPNNALAHAYYAEILADLDLYDQAGLEARRALDLGPDLLESQRAMGYVLERITQYEDAAAYYQAALAINPNLPLLHVSLGNMYRAEGDIDAAVESYLRANSLSPTDPDPLTLLAATYARVGEYGRASQWAAEAVRQDPSDPRLHGNLGRMYYHNNEEELAIPELALAVQGGVTEEGVAVSGLPLDPGSPSIVEYYYTYGLALAKQGRCEEAIPLFETLLRGVPDDEIAQANSIEGLVVCGVIEPTATPRPTTTPAP
jgi:tetratricopeptide (TPR) repeat protein